MTITKAAKIAASYARASLDQQKDNFSLPSQRRAMLKLASEQGYTGILARVAEGALLGSGKSALKKVLPLPQ
jgi:hypothetical protein